MIDRYVDRPEFAPVEGETLPRVLQDQGFVPPPRGFLAFVAEVRDVPGGTACRSWDWHGTSRATGWWPASTVKVFAAAAALDAVAREGFTAAAVAEIDEPGGTHRESIASMVQAAVGPSDNAAFDRLVWVAGHAQLRAWLATRFPATSLWRGYSGMARDPATGFGTLARAPAVTLREGDRSVARPGAIDEASCDVPSHGNRTTLQDLADCLRRIARHDRLSPGERLVAREGDARLLQEALASPRERGEGMADGLRAAFGAGARVLHKPGFAYDWFSDVAFVDLPAPAPSWIVAMAGRPGRDSLDAAAHHVGRLLSAGL